uniref:ZP domain-containing protein n=1 Tax=Ixodes ricinus TaxID=34613 RepID=A0A147BH47_IXORI
MSAASMSIRPVLLLLLACSITVCTSGALAPGREVLRAPTKQVIKNYFATDRTRVSLTCEPERFLVQISFTQPFRGVVHAGHKKGKCKIRGDGSRAYTLRVPLNDCSSTHNDATGSFTNSLTIRFHPSLELEGDEIKTLVCKFTTGEVNLG